MKYYFYETISEGGRNRLRPLPGQITEDGTLIHNSYNTQTAAGGMKLREAYPIGTVFCSSVCQLVVRAGTPYYNAGDIYPILDGNYNYNFQMPTPIREMLDAWLEYKTSVKPCKTCINNIIKENKLGKKITGCRYGLDIKKFNTCNLFKTELDI